MGVFLQRAGLLSSAAAGFTLADLFAAGEGGAGYEVHPDYVRQGDTEGSTAGAVGSVVGWMQDQSGNGHHAVQSTAAKKPILRQTAGGLYYLEGDGIDDVLTTGTSLDLSGVAYALFMAWEGTGDVGETFATEGGGGRNAAVQIQAANTLRVYDRGDGTVSLDTAITGIASSKSVTGLEHDATGKSSRHNGSTVASHSVSTTDNAGVTPLAVFGVNSTSKIGGHFFGGVALGRSLTSGERDDLEGWLADKIGITL